jgi:hypothetical protein
MSCRSAPADCRADLSCLFSPSSSLTWACSCCVTDSEPSSRGSESALLGDPADQSCRPGAMAGGQSFILDAAVSVACGAALIEPGVASKGLHIIITVWIERGDGRAL